MANDEYISNNLYKMTRNDAKNNASVNTSLSRDNLSKAQLRRLSDVYNAKIDLMARMERSITRLAMLNDELENIIEKRKKSSVFLKQNLEKLQSLVEPDGGRELHEYLREVEHLRMEYFRTEAEIEPLIENLSGSTAKQNTSSEFGAMKAGNLLKIGFFGMLPVLLTILISALIVGAAVILAMKI